MSFDKDEAVEDLARDIYREQVWQPGMPSWENAAWDQRTLCRKDAKQMLGRD